MQNRRNRPTDILCAGELLIDLISVDYAESFEEVKSFERHFGGSPANLCMNMARLGNKTKLAATVGTDGMGDYLKGFVENMGVDCTHLRQVKEPTTLILVTKTRKVANFEAYRGADTNISASQMSKAILKNCSLFHTTCFALSQHPAKRNIYEAAKRAVQLGCQLSIDANYAQKIWPDQAEARQIVAGYCKLGAIVKVSEVDWERLYGSPLKDAEKAAAHFLDLGAAAVCVTLGGDGAFAASAGEGHFLPARPVEVKDTTGAGDAFWSGFLTAWLDGHSVLNCAKAGRRMAELKIGVIGPLPDKVDKTLIYSDF